MICWLTVAIYRSGFLNFSTTNILRWISSARHGAVAVPCTGDWQEASLASPSWMTGAKLPPSVVTIKNISRHCQMSPRAQNHPQLKISTIEKGQVPF